MCKATWAAAAAAAEPSTSTSTSNSQGEPHSAHQDGATSSPEPEQAVATQPDHHDAEAQPNPAGHSVTVDIMQGANGYLAAAELVLQLHLPGLASQLLHLAAGGVPHCGGVTGATLWGCDRRHTECHKAFFQF
jgi:hypothetical protein